MNWPVINRWMLPIQSANLILILALMVYTNGMLHILGVVQAVLQVILVGIFAWRVYTEWPGGCRECRLMGRNCTLHTGQPRD